MRYFAGRLTLFLIFVVVMAMYGCASTPAAGNSSVGGDSPDTSLRVATQRMPDGESASPYWAPLIAKGGRPPYRWSVANGQLPNGLALDPAQGIVSGTASEQGEFPFTLRVEDSEASARAELRIHVNAQGAGLQGCAGGGCYGPGIGADGLANTTVGPNGNMVSYRFRAQKTGVMEQLRLYLIPDRTGYSGGTSGQLQVTIVEDDGTAAHNPSPTKLASYLLADPLAAKPSPYFPLLTFASPPTLVASRLYHIVFTNADPNPTVNYLSVDTLYLEAPTTPVQPSLGGADRAVLLNTNGSWSPRRGYTPIMELLYADGSSNGIGYMEGWVGAPRPVSGSDTVRESFTVSGPARRITTVGIRAARVTGNDNLHVRLENADGSLIEEGLISASAFPLSSEPQHRWGSLGFSSMHVLTPGKKYNLVLEAPAASSYQVFPIRKGTDYGFADSTFFPDGSAEFKDGNKWVGWTQWGKSNRTDSDLQFYFGLAPVS